MKHTFKHDQGAAKRFFRASVPVFLLAVVFCGTVPAQSTVRVSTLQALREAMQKSNQTIVMKPGSYSLTALSSRSRNLSCSGSNNTIDLSGVSVSAPVGATRRGYLSISGDHNTFKGGTFEDVYPSGLNEVTDFSAYNRNRSTLAKGLSGSAVFSISGDGNTVVGTKLTIRGSYPYGYGSIYGIGANNVYGLDKRCGILINGRSNTIRNETEYPIILQSSASGNTVVSFGPVTDLGKNNKITRIEQPEPRRN